MFSMLYLLRICLFLTLAFGKRASFEDSFVVTALAGIAAKAATTNLFFGKALGIISLFRTPSL
jgi:hypothetical protein